MYGILGFVNVIFTTFLNGCLCGKIQPPPENQYTSRGVCHLAPPQCLFTYFAPPRLHISRGFLIYIPTYVVKIYSILLPRYWAIIPLGVSGLSHWGYPVINIVVLWLNLNILVWYLSSLGFFGGVVLSLFRLFLAFLRGYPSGSHN